ncbi:hypothetical protein [Plantactinospora sonchi]|uniref:Uncharacterized protein n=1 Tax=Plantactinospora sonchi TaxID=1544735 RepID=A0ABU7RXV8_9ACTN
MSVTQQPRRSWARSIWGWIVTLVSTAVAIWIVVQVLPDFELTGPGTEQMLALAVITVVFLAGVGLLPLPLYWLLGRSARRNVRQMAQEPDPDASDREFFAPFRRMMVLTGVGTAVGAVVTVVLAPVVLWLSARLCEVLGLPVRLSGLWPTVFAAALVAIISTMVGDLLQLPTGRRRAWRTLRFLAAYLLPMAGLWLTVAWLDNATLRTGDEQQHLFVLVVLAVVFARLDFEVSAPLVTLILMLVINAFKLWLLSWLSSWMILPLQISGFWTFVLAALIVTIVTLPNEWLKPRRPPEPTMHDPFMDSMHTPTTPYY